MERFLGLKLQDLTPDLGILMVKYARKTLEYYLSQGKILPPLFNSPILKKKAGFFCTLKKDGQLRGCVGYPSPIYPLGEVLIKSTIQSAIHDPRFNPMKHHELTSIKIELTVLTTPELLDAKPSEYSQHIMIGRDGLIVQSLNNPNGLLLPQVPVEQDWSIQQFLEHTCLKAGLHSNSWKDSQLKFYTFHGRIFKE